MPRGNVSILILALTASFFCYQRADSAKRSAHRRAFGIIHRAMSIIEEGHVQPVADDQLLEGALRGMAGTLDEYSGYIDPKSYREFRETLDQTFGGVGIQVTLEPESKQLMVTSPLVGTPAFEAGILAGDRLLEINGESTEGFTLEDAVTRLRGQPGEAVTLKIQHDGVDQVQIVSVTRRIIEVDTVLGDVMQADGRWNYFLEGQDHIALVRVSSFGERTLNELKTTLERLTAEGMKGLVLDLRNNPGGLLESAVEVCDLFVPEGRIVSTLGRDQTPVSTYDASGKAPYVDLPIVVLVNNYSASASEIVSACLQDHQRAVVVGERTWGKGSVQQLIDLEPGQTALKLTTASYWRPSGENIHRFKDAKPEDQWGVKPNPGWEVPLTEEELRALLLARRDRDVYRPIRSSPASPRISPSTGTAPESPSPVPTKKEPSATEPSTTDPSDTEPSATDPKDSERSSPDVPVDSPTKESPQPNADPTIRAGQPIGGFRDVQLEKALEYFQQAKPTLESTRTA